MNGPDDEGRSGNGAGHRPTPGPARSRPGRRALFSDPAEGTGVETGPADLPDGRRAVFSSTTPAAPEPGHLTAVVHCRTCLSATPMSLAALGLSLVPSLWVPTRPWPRLMRCPACHRVSWCRIDWPRPF